MFHIQKPNKQFSLLGFCFIALEEISIRSMRIYKASITTSILDPLEPFTSTNAFEIGYSDT